MAAENQFDAFGDGIPDSDCSVFGSGGEAATTGRLKVVRFPCQTGDPFSVAFQWGSEGFASLGVP